MRQWQSVKHAQLEISSLVRPILEAIRNGLRNSILSKNGKKRSIELRAEHLTESSTVCRACEREPIQMKDFWVYPDLPHDCCKQLNSCSNCSCSFEKHFPIRYKLYYGSYEINKFDCDLTSVLNILISSMVLLSHFFHHIIGKSNDPFLPGIRRFINEEQKICAKYPSHSRFNGQLLGDLVNLKDYHENRLQEMKYAPKNMPLKMIYDCIEQVQQLPMVSLQMAAVRQTQKEIRENNEHRVPTEILRSKASRCLQTKL